MTGTVLSVNRPEGPIAFGSLHLFSQVAVCDTVSFSVIGSPYLSYIGADGCYLRHPPFKGGGVIVISLPFIAVFVIDSRVTDSVVIGRLVLCFPSRRRLHDPASFDLGPVR